VLVRQAVDVWQHDATESVQIANGTLNMKISFLKATSAVAGIILAGNVGVRGDTLYQDTANPSGQVMNLGNNQQVGEQVWLGPTAPEYLTNFSFQYYSAAATYSGSVQMDVRLYANDGTLFNGYARPGTVLFDSGNFTLANPWSVNGTNSATVVFQLSDLLSGTTPLNQNLSLPTNFTFSVTVSGLSGADAVGLPIFGPAQVGWNAGDYWYDVSGNWQLLTNSSGPVAFGSQFLGQTTPTPEPTVLGLGALGAAALLVIARRRQRRE
jgi:MYXO-CTERM domain-containing protein